MCKAISSRICQMTVLFLSTFLSIRRKISDMQRFLSSGGGKLVYKQQEGKFKLPCTKIIIICSSPWRALIDQLRVRIQARSEEADVQLVLLGMRTACDRQRLHPQRRHTQCLSILLWKLTVVWMLELFFYVNHGFGNALSKNDPNNHKNCSHRRARCWRPECAWPSHQSTHEPWVQGHMVTDGHRAEYGKGRQ